MSAAPHQTANEITAALLLAIPVRFPLVRCWRSNRIDAMAVGAGGKMRRVQAGVDGQGDISGIAGVKIGGILVGVRCELEVKSGRDAMRQSQKAFQAMISRHGGLYLVCRDVDTALNDLQQALARYQLEP